VHPILILSCTNSPRHRRLLLPKFPLSFVSVRPPLPAPYPPSPVVAFAFPGREWASSARRSRRSRSLGGQSTISTTRASRRLWVPFAIQLAAVPPLLLLQVQLHQRVLAPPICSLPVLPSLEASRSYGTPASLLVRPPRSQIRLLLLPVRRGTKTAGKSSK